MPKLSKFKITKRSVEALPTSKDVTFRDSELKGFAIRTKTSGTKIYLAIYRNAEGRTRSYALGTHDPLSADEARKLAKAALAKVDAGGDPAEQRKLDREAITVAELCIMFLKDLESGKITGRKGAKKKPEAIVSEKGRINRHIVPLLGKTKVRDLNQAKIKAFMRAVTDGKTAVDERVGYRARAIVKGGAGAASRSFGTLAGLMAYALDRDIISVSPCRGMKVKQGEPRKVRLDPDQYRALGDALTASDAEGETWQAVKAFRLLALTGCRLNEIGHLKWSEVDIDGQALRLADSKTGASIRPIGSEAVSLLSELSRSSDHVFPALRVKKQPYGGLAKAWARILARAKDGDADRLAGLTPHSLRHAYASVGGDLGLSELTISALLGHTAGGVTRRYVHHLDAVLIATANRVCETIACQMAGTITNGDGVE